MGQDLSADNLIAVIDYPSTIKRIQIMFELLAILFAGLFAPVPVSQNKTTGAGRYHEGDNSNWIVTDNGPMQGSLPR